MPTVFKGLWMDDHGLVLQDLAMCTVWCHSMHEGMRAWIISTACMKA